MNDRLCNGTSHWQACGYKLVVVGGRHAKVMASVTMTLNL